MHGAGAYQATARSMFGADVPVPSASMRVWIDQDLCTGDGLCVDHCPDVFVQLEDGIAYVTEAACRSTIPAARARLADVPRAQRAST